MSLRPSVQANVPSRGYTTSPGTHSVHSVTVSLHTPFRKGSYAAMSRSPSAFSTASQGLPSSPRPVTPSSLQLPSTFQGITSAQRHSPALYPGVAARNHVKMVSDLCGRSSPDSTPNQRLEMPDWVATRSDRPVDFKQWRKNVLEAADMPVRQ